MTASNEDIPVIEYYYALASPWAYLGNAALRRISERYEVGIDPYIIDYDQMFEATGTVPLPRRPPLRKSYRLVELARWRAIREVPLNPEPKFYRGEVEEPDERGAALLVTAARSLGHDSLVLAHALSRALWAEERFPFRDDEMKVVCEAEGFDYLALKAAAGESATAKAYQAATDRSVARGVFGMPFYIFRDEPFWGQDRIELLEQSVRRFRDPAV